MSARSDLPLRLIVVLHGVGSTGAGFQPVADAFAAALPGVMAISPDAPYPHETGGRARQFFSVLGVTAENRAARVAQAADAFDAMMDGVLRAADASEQETALVGFSQGTIMALDAVTRRRPFAAVVGYSGRLARTPNDALSDAPRVLLVHGTADMVIPHTESLRAEAALSAARVRVRTELLNGVGHTLTGTAVQLGIEFLRSQRGHARADAFHTSELAL